MIALNMTLLVGLMVAASRYPVGTSQFFAQYTTAMNQPQAPAGGSIVDSCYGRDCFSKDYSYLYDALNTKVTPL